MGNSGDPTAFNITFDPTVKRMSGYALHGNTPFDVPFISELKPGFFQGGTETGLILPRNIKHLISLYPWERYTVKQDLTSELYVRMYDSTNQSFQQVDEIAEWVNAVRADGPTVVLCQAGLNRSSLIAARALMTDPFEPMPADEAISLIRSKRSPACLCNPHFEEWLREQ